ncbi:MAG: signal peptidase II [Chlamydiales bacterium]
MRRLLLLSLFALSLFLGDFFLKSYVHHFFPPMGLVPIFPYGGVEVFENFWGIDFSLVHVINKGAAWGILSSFHEYLFYGRVLIIGAMLFYLLLFAARMQVIPLVMIITGAIGNVADRFLYGHVVDMFYFRFWGHSFPVFNIADSAIFCGISILMLQSFIKKKREEALPAHE